MSWLSRLPHQIPFRAASTGRRTDNRTIAGEYLCTANDVLPAGVMMMEAMAQIAGALVFRSQGFFTGIDGCTILRQVEPGDVLQCIITLEAEFGGTFRFSGTGSVDGVEVVKGRFYLSGSTSLNAQT